ncbi:MAG: phosphoribosylglycinamide formyltransferase [Candidatus Methanomethylicia archaeon]
MGKLRIGVLGSTRGTDLEGIFKAIEDGRLRDVEVVCVISNKRDAYILERARQRGVEAIFIDPKGKDRETYDREVAAELDKRGVDLILLIGYMRILSPWFVNKYRWKIMNIHPSLLPAFAGGMDLEVHKAVLDYGVKVTGCTLHFVDEGVDTGPIILQKAVPVEEDDTPDTLKPKVQKAEQEIIIEAIKLFQEGRLKVEGRRVRILPPTTSIEHNLKVGMSLTEEYQTSFEHAARNIGSGDVQVLSTPSMIAFMEITSNKLAQQSLPEGYITVGSSVNVKHLNPAPIGEKIKVTSEIVKIEGRKITFKVSAMWKDIIIGEGEHERFIVNTEKFLGKLKGG